MKVVRKPIDMIAKFAQDGTITPVKFRILNEDESWKEIKIDNIISRDIEKFAGNKMLVFNCQSLLNDQMRLYQLKYEIDSCKWMLFKI